MATLASQRNSFIHSHFIEDTQYKVRKIMTQNFSIHFVFVIAHIGIEWNELADKFAKAAA